MGIIVSPEQKQRAIRLYKNKNLTLKEISNLSNISEPHLAVIYRQAFELGLLKPRREDKALKPRTPNGQGKPKYIPTGVGSGGRQKERKKFNEEQEREIAIDYYERNLTCAELKEKWGIHPVQMQRIRKQYSQYYGKKANRNINAVQQFDKEGNLVAEFENGHQASKQTNIRYVNINQCCNGRVKSAGGYVWKFK